MAGPGRIDREVHDAHALGRQDQRRSRGVARQADRLRRRWARRRAGHRDAAGRVAVCAAHQRRARPHGARQHPASRLRDAGRSRQGRRAGSAGRRSRRIPSLRSRPRRRHLAARDRQRQVRRDVAGRLASCRRCRGGRFQRRWQVRPRGRRIRLLHDREYFDPREQDQQLRAAPVHQPRHRSAPRKHSRRSRPI